MPPRHIANPFRAERFGGFVPFLWYGMRFGPWLRLLAAGRFRITLNRLPNIIGVTLLSLPTSLFHLLSEAIFRRRAQAIEILPPVFVLGHWRTGTTFLHNLLARDSAVAYPTTFECVFPSGFLLFERTGGWALSLFLPQKRPTDDVPVGRFTPASTLAISGLLEVHSTHIWQAWATIGPIAIA
jgi:omega-hydroxy-beta-dihydromenaquinone-9 sulfotransferase